MWTTLLLIAGSAMTSASLVWLVAARGPHVFLGGSASDGFEDRFEAAHDTFTGALKRTHRERWDEGVSDAA